MQEDKEEAGNVGKGRARTGWEARRMTVGCVTKSISKKGAAEAMRLKEVDGRTMNEEDLGSGKDWELQGSEGGEGREVMRQGR